MAASAGIVEYKKPNASGAYAYAPLAPLPLHQLLVNRRLGLGPKTADTGSSLTAILIARRVGFDKVAGTFDLDLPHSPVDAELLAEKKNQKKPQNTGAPAPAVAKK